MVVPTPDWRDGREGRTAVMLGKSRIPERREPNLGKATDGYSQ
jgi:hypothetical protein